MKQRASAQAFHNGYGAARSLASFVQLIPNGVDAQQGFILEGFRFKQIVDFRVLWQQIIGGVDAEHENVNGTGTHGL